MGPPIIQTGQGDDEAGFRAAARRSRAKWMRENPDYNTNSFTAGDGVEFEDGGPIDLELETSACQLDSATDDELLALLARARNVATNIMKAMIARIKDSELIGCLYCGAKAPQGCPPYGDYCSESCKAADNCDLEKGTD